MVVFRVVPFYRRLKRQLCVGKPERIRILQVRAVFFEGADFGEPDLRQYVTARIAEFFELAIEEVDAEVVDFPGTAEVLHEKTAVVFGKTPHIECVFFGFVQCHFCHHIGCSFADERLFFFLPSVYHRQ